MKTGSMFANGRIRSVRDIGFNFFDDLAVQLMIAHHGTWIAVT